MPRTTNTIQRFPIVWDLDEGMPQPNEAEFYQKYIVNRPGLMPRLWTRSNIRRIPFEFSAWSAQLLHNCTIPPVSPPCILVTSRWIPHELMGQMNVYDDFPLPELLPERLQAIGYNSTYWPVIQID